ncbi:unnamed protein product [Arabidopsis lyrata]|uniref:Expressed protein n=1 Tax=Arabidopsis lyrata subsp. lyrata TaxID=81972 RepID=D7KHD6_ARALL|nr:uncharacterized protein LOC9326396 [Arabidopsis lyrata subsp. lyrata]EFH69307.1 expressed protein [Arabidopsis lyrata subsp. lyrata]CAH8252842.1 unnamed protein product [Arabidopsis lyrata]|eukprot:XP_002893048.1 uncharacterized protein LOC9326396 [Arabidopsis lyrata subsp. lyrata]
MEDQDLLVMGVRGFQDRLSKIERSLITATKSLHNLSGDFEYIQSSTRGFRTLRIALEEQLWKLSRSNPEILRYDLCSNELERSTINIGESLAGLSSSEKELMVLLETISKETSAVYSDLEDNDELIRGKNLDQRLKAHLNGVNKTMNRVSASLEDHKKKFDMLCKDIQTSSDAFSPYQDALSTSLVFTISKQIHFPLLKRFLGSDEEKAMGSLTDAELRIVDGILKYIPVLQLRRLMNTNPHSDITIIKCWDRVLFSYWKENKDHVTVDEFGNRWSSKMGDIINQLDHEVCWAIVIVDLVSAVRHILRRDTQKVKYSAQYLVDFTRANSRSRSSSKKNKPGHSCYACPVLEGLKYVQENGIETEAARPFDNAFCKKGFERRSSLNLAYIKDVVKLSSIEETIKALDRHPVAATIPIFEPEYSMIGENIYRGRTSTISRYSTTHAINITGVGKDKKTGEKFVWAKSSHGLKFGVAGYMKVSIEMMMMCLTTGKYGEFVDNPFRSLFEFVYPTLLSEEDEEKRKRQEDVTSNA